MNRSRSLWIETRGWKGKKYTTYSSSSSALWCHWFIRIHSERFVQREIATARCMVLERKERKKSYEGKRDLLDKHAQTATNCLMLDFPCSGGKAKLDQTIYAVARSSSCFYFARFDVRKHFVISILSHPDAIVRFYPLSLSSLYFIFLSCLLLSARTSDVIDRSQENFSVFIWSMQFTWSQHDGSVV